MGMNHTDADNALADVLWWLRGFEAATTSDHDDTVHDLWTGLRNIRNWLSEMARGGHRLLGLSENARAIVITEAEFEAILDGLQRNTEEDREAGRQTARAIFDQYAREARELANPTVPF